MNSLSRRAFLKTSAAVGASTLPLFSIARAGASANTKINVAVVGVGGMGGYAYRRARDKENLVALCDVDFARGGRALGNHPNLPRFKDFRVMRDRLSQIERLPSGGPGPVEEWFAAIKGGPAPGSPFDYAAPLTEMVLIGALAQRSGKTIEWDDTNMQVKGQPELDSWIKGPVRHGWEYG